jgi:hypothetical protein
MFPNLVFIRENKKFLFLREQFSEIMWFLSLISLLRRQLPPGEAFNHQNYIIFNFGNTQIDFSENKKFATKSRKCDTPDSLLIKVYQLFG